MPSAKVLCGAVMLASLALPSQPQQQSIDDSFPAQRKPSYAASGPRVLYDDGHGNVFSSEGRGRSLVRLFGADGATIQATKQPFTAPLLAAGDVLVTMTATAREGSTDAYDQSEVSATRDWVRSGGSLLVVADHYPFDRAMASLLRAFEVRIGEGIVADARHFDNSAQNTWLLQKNQLSATFWLLFTRQNQLLGDHPITNGDRAGERVERILSFGGTSVSGPDGAAVFLKLSDSARPEHVPDRKGDIPRLEQAQGLAFPLGKGRVVVLADASMVAAQIRRVDGVDYPFGMNRADVDNAQLALNILHWLSPRR